MPKINSLEVVHQDTNKDSYQNLHDILVDLNKSLALNKEIVDKDARASIENLLEMYVNDKEAFLHSVLTLTAQFKSSQAQYSEEILLRASEIEALARKISVLSASVDTANAALYEETNLRVTADEAFAQSISTLSATVGSKNRTYYQTTAPTTTGLVSGDLWIDSDDGDKLYRWNGSSWVNIQDAQIGVNTAAITNEATARATADSANATSINAVTARLDTGDFATVKTQSSTTASKVAGIEAKWGVTTNVNGYVAGIQLLNGGSTSSSFTVDASKFIVKKPDGTNGIEWNGTSSRLNVSGDIYANNLYGNVVNTGNVVDNAINKPSTTSIGTTTVQNSETVYITLTITTSVSCNIYASSSTGMSFPSGTNDSRFNLKIDGNIVATMHTGSAYVQSIAMSGALAVSAGTHTIQFTGWRSGSPTVEIESGSLYGVAIQK